MGTTIKHKPVLLSESINGLNINPGGIYVDLTYGGGGHSAEILKHLGKGRLIAFDQDPEAANNILTDKRFTFIRSNFRYFRNFLTYLGIKKVNGVIADLGISSGHIDNPERGFSYKVDCPLDMRMNTSAKKTAAWIVNNSPEKELRDIFKTFGELHNSAKISELIETNRKKQTINTSLDLCRVLAPIIPKNSKFKFLSQVFQSLRIAVNEELDSLCEMLIQTPDIIEKGGRLVIITFHSLEDRIVKNFHRTGNFSGMTEKDFFGQKQTPPFVQINRKVIVPAENEIYDNVRARSAKLRIAERNG